MNKIVHLVGDSTLDTIYWELNGRGDNLEEARNNCVEGQLQNKLNANSAEGAYQVVNHAYDGFTTSSVLKGDNIGSVLMLGGTKYQAYMREKKLFAVKPLELLEAAMQKSPRAIHYVVLSVGGNDFRENLAVRSIGDIFFKIPRLIGDVPQIQNRYLQIVERIQALKQKHDVRPILMFQYRTAVKGDPYMIYPILGTLGWIAAVVNTACLATIGFVGHKFATHKITGFSPLAFAALAALGTIALSKQAIPFKVTLGILFGRHSGITMISALMEKFYRPMLSLAHQNKLPILDLPNSFNPFRPLYTCGIEPSKKGARLIAKGLTNLIQKYPTTESRRFLCNGQECINDGSNWGVAYVTEKTKLSQLRSI